MGLWLARLGALPSPTHWNCNTRPTSSPAGNCQSQGAFSAALPMRMKTHTRCHFYSQRFNGPWAAKGPHGCECSPQTRTPALHIYIVPKHDSHEPISSKPEGWTYLQTKKNARIRYPEGLRSCSEQGLSQTAIHGFASGARIPQPLPGTPTRIFSRRDTVLDRPGARNLEPEARPTEPRVPF